MNERLLDLINGHAGQLPVLDQAAKFAATDGLFVLAALIAAFGGILLRRDLRGGLTVAATAGIAMALAGGLVVLSGLVVTEDRPFTHDTDTVLLVAHAADNSFPSDHTTVATAIAVVASLAWRRWAPAFLVLAALIGLARVYVGVHYPGDIVGGAIIGAAAAGAAWAVGARTGWLRLEGSPW
jgi:undecaprenyl-diphosphatase